MITVRAQTFDAFVRAFTVAVRADDQATAVGGNEFTLPDDVDPAVLRMLTNLDVTVVGEPVGTDVARKTNGSTTRKRERE